jgi:Leucine-rich repeat (LRR) protein
VFKETTDLETQYPELVEQAEMILRKCNGLPLAIVTIGGFLANQPKNQLEWRKLNEHISAELERNPKLETIRNVLMRSYDGLPYHLKSCFLYMPIFPEDYKVGRGRLVRRWTGEGYSREVRGKSMEEIADDYFMELISRSIILPAQVTLDSTKEIKSCQLHDLIRENGISKSMEENLVFTLEEGCSSNSQATTRHLAINGNWKGDRSEFESIVDMSRVRSVTVFGEWKSFYISDKMSLLRVLDLEDTTGLHDHHLKHIGKLLHLRYLSLRGCFEIYHLPDSLGKLRELLTLDVRGTKIIKLPKSIINLQKLYNLRAGRKTQRYSEFVWPNEGVMGYRACTVPLSLMSSCLQWCVPQLTIDTDSGLSRRDVCTRMCCSVIPAMAMLLDKHGVLVPRGIKKMKALRTLGTVNIARQGKAIMQDIKRLTQLRKLGVTGVNKENGQELCEAIADLSRLESLLIRSKGEPGLSSCLDGNFLFPEGRESLQSLQRLKFGNLVKLPEWIQKLKNLVKLKLRGCGISNHGDAMQVLGKLPNLASLHLLKRSFKREEDKEVHLSFCPETFQSLVVLEVAPGSFVDSVNFEGQATPKLELLSVYLSRGGSSSSLSGLLTLSALKEVMVSQDFSIEYVRDELAPHPNHPVVRRVDSYYTL